ncbi:hypothetical protein SAMN00790413_04636 [Deinococcus hopiensis KR-140]|uniref:Uncharacterized protein n=1 Tax=Deinococcus hopiensis KR-140 TaxID=695939 RepID=A0A1W1UKQ1_9DEIO|nr:hypothetical protein SAMN00790413_04636 [Deinococcus hopiensis KR-140]
MAAFEEARRRINITAQGAVHHPDLTVEGELRRSGAFMIVEPASSTWDGTARVASQGYFNFDDMPPWDTWITTVPPRFTYEGGTGLLCWVPRWARQHVDDAIAVSADSCLHWAELHNDQVLWR